MADDRPGRRERAEQLRKERERQDKRRRALVTAAIVAVVLVVIAGAGWAVKSAVDDSASDAANAPSGLTEDGGILLGASDVGGTPAPDPVRLTVFEDLQCPVCKSFEEVSGQWLDDQVEAGAIEVEYRPIAFLTEFSADALAASMCVFDESGAQGWRDYVKVVFANQPAESGPGVDNDQLVGWAEEAGVDAAADCIEDETYRDWAGDPPDDLNQVTTDAFASTDSQGTQVSGTPTVWVDGVALSGVPQPADLEKAVAAARAG